MLKMRDKRVTSKRKSAVARVKSKGGEVNKRVEVIREIIADDSAVKSIITVDEKGELLIKSPQKKVKK